MQDSNFHLVDSRPTRSKNMGQRRHNFQQKRNVDKDDYRTVNPKSENPRHRQQQPPKRPQHWREQRVRSPSWWSLHRRICLCAVVTPSRRSVLLARAFHDPNSLNTRAL